MIYTLTVTTPSTQTINDPLRSILKVTKGLIYRIEVEFRPGPLGTLHVQIFDGGSQIWPSTAGESWNSDGYTIGFDDSYLIFSPPYQFDVITWCENASYNHEVQVRIGLVSHRVFMARFLPTFGYEELSNIIQELIQQQKTEAERQREEILKRPLSWVTREEGL